MYVVSIQNGAISIILFYLLFYARQRLDVDDTKKNKMHTYLYQSIRETEF